MLAPRGEIMPLPLSALAGSPFETYFWPGVILFSVLGIGPLVAARLAWLRHPLAPVAAAVVGEALLIWVAVEIAIIGYSNEPPLQAVYLILGLLITVLAIRWLRDVRLAMSLPSTWYRPEPHDSGRRMTVYHTSWPKKRADRPKSSRAAFV